MIVNLIEQLCGEALIDPGIVMEDEGFQELLEKKATLEELQEYINENF
tara:strand:+ start:392 stop:535 length:144 start_codon:yes stop_codon:yes gene_type:complete